MNMSTWALWAILTSFLWGIVNLLDKTVLFRFKLSQWDYLALGGFMGILPLTIILVRFENLVLISIEAIALAMLSGTALAAFYLIYFYALRIHDVTIVVILIQTSPIFSLIWGSVLLHERYATTAFIGMFLVLLGAIVASASKGVKKIQPFKFLSNRKSLASLMMLSASFVLSIGYLAQKLSLKSAGTISVFFWQRLCLFFISFLVIALRRGEIRRLPGGAVCLISLTELINLLALLAMIAAFSRGPLSTVTFLISLQPLWVLFFGWALSFIRPSIIFKTKNVYRFQLLIACILVILGISLMKLE